MRPKEAYDFYENMVTGMMAEKYFLKMSVGEDSGRNYTEKYWMGMYGYFEGIDEVGFVVFDNRGGHFWVDYFATEDQAVEALKDASEWYE